MQILDFFSTHQKCIITGGLLLALFSMADKALVTGAIFALFLAAASLFIIGRSGEEKQRRTLGMLFIIVFSIYILSVGFFYYTKFQPFSGGYGDYVVYQYQAEQIAQRVHQGNFSLKDLSVNGNPLNHSYPVMVGYVYALTLPSMLLGQLFNAWLVSVLICFVYLVVRETGGTEKEGFLTGLIASLYPSLVFYGSLLLKEAFVGALVFVALFLVLKIIKKFSVINFLLLYAILIVLTNLRFYIGYTVVLSFIIGWMLVSSVAPRKRIAYAVVMILLFGLLPQVSLGNGYFGVNLFKKYVNIDYITFNREVAYAPVTDENKKELSNEESLAQGNEMLDKGLTLFQWPSYSAQKNSSVGIKTEAHNPLAFVKNMILSFMAALLGPFPWQFNKLSQLLSLPEILAWYGILFFAIKGSIQSFMHKKAVIIPLIVFSCFVLGVLAVFITNYGIITRIRMPAFLAITCLLPLGFTKLKDINIPLLKKIYE